MSVLQTLSIICFVLAPLCAIASVIVFVKMRVMDAILFLRRRSGKGTPMSSVKSSSSSKPRRKKTKVAGESASRAKSQPAPASRAQESLGNPELGKASSPTTIGFISVAIGGARDSEADTDILDSEAATDVLKAESDDSELSTVFLDVFGRGVVDFGASKDSGSSSHESHGSEASERETEVLDERADANASERETEVLSSSACEQSETDTQVLEAYDPDAPGFAFVLKRSIVVVHTDESID